MNPNPGFQIHVSKPKNTNQESTPKNPNPEAQSQEAKIRNMCELEGWIEAMLGTML